MQCSGICSKYPIPDPSTYMQVVTKLIKVLEVQLKLYEHVLNNSDSKHKTQFAITNYYITHI